jgi:hypothetical protein
MKIVEVLKESASTYEVIYLLNGREVKRIGGIFLHDLHKFIDNYLTNPK